MRDDFRRMVERARAGARPKFEQEALVSLAPAPPERHPYARKVLHRAPTGEAMIAAWKAGARCAPHDHGGAGGVVVVLRGSVVETRYRCDAEQGLIAEAPVRHLEGAVIRVSHAGVHAMATENEAITLHLYAPCPSQARVHDLAARVSHVLAEGVGAWLPEREQDVLHTESWADVGPRRAHPVILVTHTTHYREGSAAFARASATLARKLREERPDADVWLRPLRWKRDFISLLESLADDARTLEELHFVGHSGMYGPMFGSVEWPEQLSPHEWRSLRVPFGPRARAVFHACRTGRWFSAFFARTTGVPAEGYHGYTTVSRAPHRYVWDNPLGRAHADLHVISCVGRKSHGLPGALKKHLGRASAEPLKRFNPVPADEAPSYDRVAQAYAEAFSDLRMRAPEVRFVERALAPLRERGPLRALDLGCGNGALFDALGSHLREGVGVDLSEGMIEQARRTHRDAKHLRFERVTGPELPFEDSAFDAVLSFLSFRYLDWDPTLREIARVLRPGGHFIVVDMVAKPLSLRDAPLLARSTLAHLETRLRHPRFVARLSHLTRLPEWKAMLEHNPIRAEHEYRWYLESRFPGRGIKTLSASRTARIVAFDSGPKDGSWRVEPMSYP